MRPTINAEGFSDWHKMQYARGFSLIEILIVLTIIGLAVMIIVPGIQSSLTRAEARAAAIELRTGIAALRTEAWERQMQIVLVDPERNALTTIAPGTSKPTGAIAKRQATITLQRGWRYKLSEPIIFEPRGVCNGGLARVENNAGAGLDIRLSAPFCAAEIR